MPFSLSNFIKSDVLVVGIRPVTTFWPFKSLTLLKETSGVVTIQIAAPFTTFAMMFTGAPFAAAIAVHSGPCREERGAGQGELNGEEETVPVDTDAITQIFR
jgi:hypothetical protein